VINYAHLLEEHKYFEDSFKAYERGVNLFKYPHVSPIWEAYLSKFTGRYGGKKLERTRDLYEQSLDGIPQDKAKTIYLMYAKFEEDHGLIRHAMSVYDRATRAIQDTEKLEVFRLYIAKASEFFGVTSTREIYERAIEVLPDKDVKDMCIQFADVERRLGEVDRARGIYGHAAQFCDPRIEASFWQTWNDFEVRHGNEDTFREMLRIKRSVQMRFTQVGLMTADLEKAKQGVIQAAAQAAGKEETQMEKLEREAIEKAEAQGSFIASPNFAGAKPGYSFKSGQLGVGYYKEADQEMQEAPADHNPEEINIDDDDEDDEDAPVEGGTEIEEKAVPVAVFGSVKRDAEDAEDDEPPSRPKRSRK
jgi:pre-mRNA-splicing factor SYF1